MILLVDNYDSFTYNLAQYLGTFTEVKVLRCDCGFGGYVHARDCR